MLRSKEAFIHKNYAVLVEQVRGRARLKLISHNAVVKTLVALHFVEIARDRMEQRKGFYIRPQIY